MSTWNETERLRIRQEFDDRWHARYVRSAWVSGVGAAFFVFTFAAEAGSGWASGTELGYLAGSAAVIFLRDLALDLRKLGVPWI